MLLPQNAQEDFAIAGSAGGDNSYSQGFDDGKVPVDEVAIAAITNRVQTVSFKVNEFGFSPALIIMQKDVETKWIIIGEKLDGCNYSLSFPSYEASLELVPGENVIEFIPTADFSFSCWMGTRLTVM